LTAEQNYLQWEAWDTSLALLRLGTAVQATADSLRFAWLKHRLVPNSLSACPYQEHEWHKTHRSVQA